MSDWMWTQAGCFLVILLAAGAWLWRFYTAVYCPARLRSFQYRIFAVRDRVIRLVADGTMSEDDPKWQALYASVNESARIVNVAKMENGFVFVMDVLKQSPPSEGILGEALPDSLRLVVVDWCVAIFTICWEGSLLLRLFVRVGGFFINLLKSKRAEEMRNFYAWQQWESCLRSA